MDLPLFLDEKATFVTGVEELRQDIYLLLKEPIMTWYQSCSVGSRISLHTPLIDSEIPLKVKSTLEQIKGMEINDIIVKGNKIGINISYNGQELKEVFDMNGL